MSEIYAITRPPQVQLTKPPPLLVLLHGFGSNEHDLMGLAPYLASQFHIVSARAIYDVGFGYAWYYLYGVPGNLQHDNASRAQSLTILKRFVAELPGHVGADASRVYLLGFSQGAVMSLSLALTAPELVSGVVAISGYLDEQIVPYVEPEQLEGRDFLVMHGSLDDLIPVTGGRATRDYLRNTPARLSYHEYPIGHSIHPDAIEVIQSWFDRINPPE